MVEIKRVSTKRKFKKYLKPLKNGSMVLDFEKISKLGFLSHLIISERGATGKTLNAKEMLRKSFIETGRPSIWLRNTIALVEKSKKDFFTDLSKPNVVKELTKDANEFWTNAQAVGSIKDNLGEITYNGKQFVKLLAIAHSELMKDARVPYRHIVLDEFNVKGNIPNYSNLFASLMHSIEDVVSQEKIDTQVWFFGNNKSLNNPLIVDLGVSYIDCEVTEIWVNDLPTLLILNNEFNDQDKKLLDDKYAKNPIYQFSKLIGDVEHSYFNESLYDEIHSIVRYNLMGENGLDLSTILTPVVTIYNKGEYVNVYNVVSGKDLNKHHMVRINNKKNTLNTIITFNSTQVIENVIYRPDLRTNFINELSKNKTTFEDIYTRDIFIRSLK